MQNVLIIDERPHWMVKEDREYACRTFCSQYKRCASRVGFDCRKLGGTEIPKVRG